MASAMTDLSTQALYERYELLKGHEEHKNNLIEVRTYENLGERSKVFQELLHRLDKSNKGYEQERLDHARVRIPHKVRYGPEADSATGK